MQKDHQKLIADEAELHFINKESGERKFLGTLDTARLSKAAYTEEPIGPPFLGKEITFDLKDAEFDVEALKELLQPKRIETLKDAADYAYGLSETRKEMADIEEVTADQIAKLQAQIDGLREWNEEVIKPLRNKADYFQLLLSDFHRRQYESADSEKAKGRVTSIKLPYGITLSSRHQQPKLEIADEAALLEYARANDAVQVIEKPKWADLKKSLTVTDSGQVVNANGEAVPFVEAVFQERKFEVK